MKIVSWNVNGIRACRKKGFLDWLQSEKADAVCIQETKCQPDQLDDALLKPKGYKTYWHSAQRKGYSSVATFCRRKPVDVTNGIAVKRFDDEGRVLMTSYPQFNLLNIYFPNGTSGDERLQYKLDFYDATLDFCQEMRDSGKELIICGDYNTAHHEIDLARPKENVMNSGFLPEEREKIDQWVEAGYVDIFRHLHPDEEDHYTWWSYRTKARDRNIGWRIDYFMVTPALVKKCKEVRILADVLGSDHCPVLLNIKN